jgi:hypothetical protein
MTTGRFHERSRVTAGGEFCTFGSPWPCKDSAEARLAALRDRITLDRGIYDGYARDYDERGEYSHASRYLGRAAQCDALLAAMDEMEAGQ